MMIPNAVTNIAGRNRAEDRSRLGGRIETCRALGFSRVQRAIPEPLPGSGWKDCDGLPDIHASALSPASLKAALASQGALIVRNLLPVTVVPPLRAAIDEVIESCARAGAANRGQQRSHYYDPPDVLREVMKGPELGRSRAFHRDSGSAMCAEAPSVAEALLDLFGSLGLKMLVEDYLGEQPCLSVKKWVLRKTRLPVHKAGWHQDGAFMGADISSLNLWLPLTRCGGDTGAPGMDLVPLRLWEIVSADGAMFDWSVDPEQVQHRFPGSPPISPVFEPGDALFFDHFLLHRTQYRPQFAHPRYAIETWFFGRGSAPCNQVPLAW